MTRKEPLVAPVDALRAVSRIREGGRERAGYVALDRNERLSRLPGPMIERLRSAIESELLTSYPMVEDLYDDLAGVLGIHRERLLLTPGSDAAFRSLYQAYVRRGDAVVMLQPSYAMYPIYARMFDAEPIAVPFAADLTLDRDELIAAISPGVRMVLLANPNQPTGTGLSPDLLRDVIGRAGECGALVVIDEAYFPFSRSSVISWLDCYPQLVVTRTFSKAWGLAGLRLGFAAAHPDVIASLYKVRSAYDINAFTALCARILLAHPEVVSDYISEVDAGRKVIHRRARGLGVEALPGETNFQLIRCRGRIDPETLVTALCERGYLVKGPFADACLSGCIRITLGAPELMTQFCDVLEEVLGDR